MDSPLPRHPRGDRRPDGHPPQLPDLRRASLAAPLAGRSPSGWKGAPRAGRRPRQRGLLDAEGSPAYTRALRGPVPAPHRTVPRHAHAGRGQAGDDSRLAEAPARRRPTRAAGGQGVRLLRAIFSTAVQGGRDRAGRTRAGSRATTVPHARSARPPPSPRSTRSPTRMPRPVLGARPRRRASPVCAGASWSRCAARMSTWTPEPSGCPASSPRCGAGLEFGPPKSAAGVRVVALPAAAVEALRTHLARASPPTARRRWSSPATRARCCGPATSGGRSGGPDRRGARAADELPFPRSPAYRQHPRRGLGASTRELMHRMGHVEHASGADLPARHQRAGPGDRRRRWTAASPSRPSRQAGGKSADRHGEGAEDGSGGTDATGTPMARKIKES